MEKSINQLKTYNFNVERYRDKHSESKIEDLNIFQKRLDEIENFQKLVRKEIQVFERTYPQIFGLPRNNLEGVF